MACLLKWGCDASPLLLDHVCAMRKLCGEVMALVVLMLAFSSLWSTA